MTTLKGTLYEDLCTFMILFAQFFLEWEMFQTKVVEKTTTHILCVILFFYENRALYEIRWKNIVDPNRPRTTLRRMRIECWIPKTTDTLKICITVYVHCLACSLLCLRFLLSAVTVLWRKLVGWICACTQKSGIMLSDKNEQRKVI